jgi:hypothetical protein
MKSIVLLLLALACFDAQAYEMLLRDGRNVVRLYEGPCVHAGTLGMLKPEMRDRFRKATAIFNGKPFYACWTYEEDGPKVFLLYEDGDQQRYEPSRFKPDHGV